MEYNLKFLLLNGELSKKRCRGIARHTHLYKYIDSQLKNERIEFEIGKAIENEIRINGERATWAFIFDYGLKGEYIFSGGEIYG